MQFEKVAWVFFFFRGIAIEYWVNILTSHKKYGSQRKV